MNLDSVTAGLMRPQCGLTERSDHLPDFGNGHFPAPRAMLCHKGRGAYGLLLGQRHIRLAAGMGKPDDNLAPGLMNSRRHCGKTGNEPGVMECHMPRPGHSLRADGNYEAHAPFGKLHHEVDELRVTLLSAVASPSQVADLTKRLGKLKPLILVASKMPEIYLNTAPRQQGTVIQPQGTSGYFHSHTP